MATRQALAILAAGVVLGFGSNLLRDEPLPLTGSLDPPPEPEPGADLPAGSPEEALARWEEGAFFLDVRPETEYELRRVAGAFSVDARRFESRYFEVVAGFGPDLPLFVYGAGPDSHAVRRTVAALREYGHPDVGFVVCGLDRLLAAGLDAATGPPEGMP